MVGDLLSGLNPQQQAAVQATDGPMLILAGAGSGKTRTVTHRTAHLISQKEVDPERILVVTFTNRAAGELRERLGGLLGKEESEKVWAMTFHALCLRMLRRSGSLVGIGSNFTILDTGDSRKMMLQAAGELGDAAKENKDDLSKMKSIISKAKNAGQGPDDLSGELGVRTARVWKRYTEMCREVNGLDFDDLLLQGVRMLQTPQGGALWSGRFDYVMVDEYQDVNNIQEQLLHLLCEGHQNICVVGDDSQCLAGNTLVHMADQSCRQIRDINPGDQVLACWGEEGVGPAVVSQVTERHASKMTHISLLNGVSLCSTPEHTHLVLSSQPDIWQEDSLVMCNQGPEHGLYLHGLSRSQAGEFEAQGVDVVLGRSTEEWSASLRSCSAYVLSAISERFSPGINNQYLRGPRGEYFQFKPADSVQTGDHLLHVDGSLQEVFSVETLQESQTVYDINVLGAHNFFANSICTHNSVYAFRGAQVEHILRFQEGWSGARIFKLEENYRSSPAILRAAQAVIERSHHRSDKKLIPVRPEGTPVRLLRFATHWDEASFVADRIIQLQRSGVSLEDIAVSYRTNAQSQAIEEALTEKSVSYHVVGGVGFTKRVEVQAARAYLSLLCNPRDRMAWERLSGFPRRGIGPKAAGLVVERAPEGNILLGMREVVDNPPKGINSKALNGIKELSELFLRAQAQLSVMSLGELLHWMINASGMVTMLKRGGEKERDQLANLDGLIELAERYKGKASDNIQDWVADTALQETEEQETPGGVRLMSLHASKGLEFPYFFIVGLEEQLFLRGNVDQRGLDEERRLFYVGMTRAEKELVMSYADRRRLWGREIHTQPLQFLFDLPGDVVKQRARTGKSSAPSRPSRSSRSGGRIGTSSRPRMDKPTLPPKPQADLSVQTNQFSVGMKVGHQKFGQGVVVGVGEESVDVRFGSKTRSLQVQYAKLEILP